MVFDGLMLWSRQYDGRCGNTLLDDVGALPDWQFDLGDIYMGGGL